MNDAFPEESMLQMFHSICNTEATPLKSPPPRRERPMGAEVFLAEISNMQIYNIQIYGKKGFDILAKRSLITVTDRRRGI